MDLSFDHSIPSSTPHLEPEHQTIHSLDRQTHPTKTKLLRSPLTTTSMANSMANTTTLTTHTHTWQLIPITPSITTTAIASANPLPPDGVEDRGIPAAVPAIIIASGSGSQAAAGPSNPFLQLYRGMVGQGYSSRQRQRQQQRQQQRQRQSQSSASSRTQQQQHHKRDLSTGAWVGVIIAEMLGIGLALWLLNYSWETLRR
jgi:hypothetical protein